MIVTTIMPQLIRDADSPDETNLASETSMKMRCNVWTSFLIGAKLSDAIPSKTQCESYVAY